MSNWHRIPLSTAALWHSPGAAGAASSPTTVAWLGQAGFFVRSHGKCLLIDPYLSDSLEAKYRGTEKPHKRMMAPPVTLTDVGGVDFVLCTHRHTDHMDGKTLRALAAQNPECCFLVPRAELGHAQSLGLPVGRLHGIDAGESIRLDAALEVSAVRAAHETPEIDDQGRQRFLGFILRLPDTVIYHSGDTVLFDGLVAEVKGHDITLALLPVNGRGKGVAGNFSFQEAIAFCREAGIPELVPQHFGMFAFNTVDPAWLATEIAKIDLPVCHLPDVGSSLQFNP